MKTTGTLILAAGLVLAGAPAAWAFNGGNSDSGSGLSSNGGIGPNSRTGGGRYYRETRQGVDYGYYRGPNGTYDVGPTDAPSLDPWGRRIR